MCLGDPHRGLCRTLGLSPDPSLGLLQLGARNEAPGLRVAPWRHNL